MPLDSDSRYVRPMTLDHAPLHQSLPVAGYKPQSSAKVDMVNLNKEAEERILRVLDSLQLNPLSDKRWLAIGRTHLELAWMAINRSIFQPARVTLAEDTATLAHCQECGVGEGGHHQPHCHAHSSQHTTEEPEKPLVPLRYKHIACSSNKADWQCGECNCWKHTRNISS